ncbi:peptidylprolyl isomerase [Variovorax ginsengisoli]|uniref:Chaperone SurA n=1 Tax=Variovorax ginsengisoli TaxID=363844 RepID=A0ABT9S6B0_9BURK|nr:peptidylprolyl isomerase [Variovorax ginsengisoli]MDP9899765.1 peptidyl-prolyl cis-trans isomerase SurA [Variovorax ginsengisoli]
MTHFRSSLTLACLALVAASAGAQGVRPGGGITDIMRSPRFAAPETLRAPAPTSGVPVQRAAEFIVALVNSEPITNTEVMVRVDRLVRENAEAERMPRGELTRLVLERLINERAQLQLAKENGIKVDDLTVDQAEENVARQNQITVTELRRRVIAEGLTQTEFRNDLRTQLLLTRLREREVESRVKISDVEVEQYIQDQRKGTNAAAPQQINLAQVFIEVPENATNAQVAAAQQKAQGIAQRARSGEDFAKLARELSDASDRAAGGALGLRSADRYPPLFVDATQSTPLNGIAGPVRSPAGFHVLKVLAKGDAGATDGVVTQTQARHILLRVDDQRTTAQAIAQLAEYKRRIESGTADFASLARDNSQDASAKAGGDLGWTRPGQFVPEFEEVLNRMSPGQISDPVVSRFGVHLIQLVGRREAKLTQVEQREATRAVLREKRIAENLETWMQEVRARAYVEYRDAPQT